MIRQAFHSGNWYTDDGPTLEADLTKWFQNVTAVEHADNKSIPPPIPGVRAIIAPHAGLHYSGPTAAYAYKCIDASRIRRIFILGPSHHVYLPGCALTECKEYATPLGNIKVDREIVNNLLSTKKFTSMSKTMDEKEHSIEMHLPFIYHIMSKSKHDYKIVPILVGVLDSVLQRDYGKLLAPYYIDPSNLFVISSDFCHYGKRFSFNPFSKSGGDGKPIWQNIADLDNQAMDLIEAIDVNGFNKYLKQTKNTICGRFPIGLLLQCLNSISSSSDSLSPSSAGSNAKGSNKRKVEDDQENQEHTEAEAQKENHEKNGKNNKTGQIQIYVKFVRYEQSSKCLHAGDSSVSYASAFVSII